MKDLIINDLQNIAKQLEKIPTRTDYFKTTSLDISRKTLLKYFESYTDALTAAGLGKKPIYVNCDTCQEQLIRTKSTISKHNFCDHSCSAKFTNTLRKVEKTCKCCQKLLIKSENIYCNTACQKEFEYHQYIQDWKIGLKIGYVGKAKSIANAIRRYMLTKTNHSCEECGWNKLHPIDNKPLVEIDHIDRKC